MRICQVCSEFDSFAKTGGLGDVSAALSTELHAKGHDVRVFLPLYGSIDRHRHDLKPVDFLQDMSINISGHSLHFSVYTAAAENGLWIYLVDCPQMFHRSSLYTQDDDEHLRFVLLSRAALESCQRMSWSPQIIHCHDWQTALIPLYLKTLYDWDQLFADTRSILSIHNLGYQGVFSSQVLNSTGLSAFAGRLWQEDLSKGIINFLKTGLVYADALTTVSPTYAREICTPEYGAGLDGLLRDRRSALIGILNGVDYKIWSPERDPLIPHPYSATNIFGKQQNKTALQRRFALQTNPDIPLIGLVSRLVYQKGFDLLFETLPPLLRDGRIQLAAIGSGEERYEQFFASLERAFPGRASYYRGFNNPLAHLVEAGSDMFLMPSLYEPCGLNQMYSLRYGTIPIVRKTGGLADTVTPHFEDDGDGIVFENYDVNGMRWALETAVRLYGDQPRWRRMMETAMSRNFSWQRQADTYVALYEQLAS